MRVRALLVAAGLSWPATARAGAWTRDPGEIYARLSLSASLPGDSYFDAERKRASLFEGSYRDLSLTIGGEIGVLERLTALVGFTVWNVSLDADLQDGRGGTSFWLPGQGSVGARYRFLDAPLLLAIQGEGRLALKREEDPAPHRWGDGRDEARVVAVGSRSLGPLWLSLELGANLRAELPAHQIVYAAQAGRWFGPAALVLDLDGAESLRKTPDDPSPLLDTVAADAFHRFGFKTIVRATPWLELDAGFLLTYLGRSFATAPRVNVGLAVIH